MGKYKTAVVISGLVTFIAAYHYFRIFNSWVDAYAYSLPTTTDSMGGYIIEAPKPTGVPFNDAYRYMDWLLTVPLLLIVIGYPGELILEADKLHTRWVFWALAMVPFLYIVYELTAGLAGALNQEEDDTIREKIWYAQRMTIVSWLTYPIVYIIPMLGAKGASAVVGIQVGYCLS